MSKIDSISFRILAKYKCAGVDIFGDAKNFCPNLILLSQITYKQQVLMLKLKRTIAN